MSTMPEKITKEELFLIAVVGNALHESGVDTTDIMTLEKTLKYAVATSQTFDFDGKNEEELLDEQNNILRNLLAQLSSRL